MRSASVLVPACSFTQEHTTESYTRITRYSSACENGALLARFVRRAAGVYEGPERALDRLGSSSLEVFDSRRFLKV